MALVTIKRSPSVNNSPQCTNSDSLGTDEVEGLKHRSLNECYFAGKSAALALGQNDILYNTTANTSPDSQTIILKSDSMTNLNKNATKPGSDIQQHLQSMFFLLRPEETLKMAVKLESARPGRSRYLVVVSRPYVNSAQTSSSMTKLPTEDEDVQLNEQITLRSAKHHEYYKAADESRDFYNIPRPINDPTGFSNPLSDYDIARDFTTDYVNSEDFSCRNCNVTSSEREESCLLGIDCNEKTSVGLALRILADTTIRLDGDGGFSVTICGRTHIFKPVSVQAMWSALQTLHKVSSKAREYNYYPGGPSHDWVAYYENHIDSDRSCLNEWNAMDSLESRRPPSPDTVRNKPTEREETERVIRTALKEIMMVVDLDEVTSKYIRSRLEEHLDMDLAEFKSFIDQEMLIILGQMDAPTEVFEHVYLGSEWNASNLEELQRNGVRHILNVTREIDNFFPGLFDYFNVRVYDDEKTDLLKHWDKTFKYITQAKIEGSKVLVHCKMGVSRSASVVIAYAMKAYNWNFEKALKHVKEKRSCIKPNKSFLSQLEMYQGILEAMKNKEKLQRSKSETNLKKCTKDARLLPGSEPTPLIQALNASKEKKLAMLRSKTLRKSLTARPKSWSPDSNAESILQLHKQQSHSLENIVSSQSSSTRVQSNTLYIEIEETRHIRLPCYNGQNYSVSQNQAVYLQQDEEINSIGKLSVELEDQELIFNTTETLPQSNVKYLNLDVTESSTSTDPQDYCPPPDTNANEETSETINTKDTWDPGETTHHEFSNLSVECKSSHNKTINPTCDSPTLVWTASAQVVHTPMVNLSISETKELLTTTISDNDDDSKSTSSRNSSHQNTNNNSSSCKKEDLFSSQLDNVFDHEEEEDKGSNNYHNHETISSSADQQTTVVNAALNPILISSHTNNNSNPSNNSNSGLTDSHVSRQSSCSSVDSAVVLNYNPGEVRDTPSRHSSWGSGDNRQAPSRNSSWGSYDMRNTKNLHFKERLKFNHDEILLMGQSGAFPYDKESLPWPLGTVKRSKQKIEELSLAKRLCSDQTTSEDSAADLSDSVKFRFPKIISNQRSQSEEILDGTCLSSSYYSRLSVSAPETSSINFNYTDNRPVPFQRKQRFSLDDTTSPEKKSTVTCDDVDETQHKLGIVRNLKKNFEAKSDSGGGGITVHNVVGFTKGSSLPSSPVALHSDASIRKLSKTNSVAENDILNVKGLVDKYEITKMRSTNSSGTFRPRPRSVVETKHNTLASITLRDRPLMLTHSKITLAKPNVAPQSDESKRPPVPPSVIRNNTLITLHTPTPFNPTSHNSSSNLINNSNTVNSKRIQQQHGKTHPLSKLGISKQRVSTATYNTM